MNHQSQDMRQTSLTGKLLIALCLVSALLMSCNQNPKVPADTSTPATENFMLALQGEQSSIDTLQSQALGSALPTGNYLCMERIRNGKALGLMVQGNTYQIAMSYENGRFFNWQSGTYMYQNIQPNPRYRKERADFIFNRGFPRDYAVLEQDSGSVLWLSGPMTAWYKSEFGSTQFYGKTKIELRRVRTGTYSSRIDERAVGDITFNVWSTNVDCSAFNFESFGGSW
jgi:hypothetical protein